MEKLQSNVCIVGGGASGIGAAYGFIGSGLSVILIDRDAALGGIMVNSNVNRWESGPDAPFCRSIYDALAPEDIILEYGEGVSYEQSITKKGYSVCFNRKKFADHVYCTLTAAGIKVLLSTEFLNIQKSSNDSIHTISARSATGVEISVSAEIFIDATSGAKLCSAMGLERIRNKADISNPGYFMGEDPVDFFGEAAAPREISDFLNAPDLCFESAPDSNWGMPVESSADPGGFYYPEPGNPKHYLFNPCGMLGLKGADLYSCGEEKLMKKVQNEAVEYFNKFKASHAGFKDFGISEFPKHIGKREDIRVNCLEMLSQKDLAVDLSATTDFKQFIAVASHPVDIHGSSYNYKTVTVNLYGIPYGCIVPKGIKNCYIVSMSAGFSHIAAASARLSRTLMQLGYAAAKASAFFLRDGKEADISTVTDHLISQIQEAVGIKTLLTRVKRTQNV